VSDRKRRLESAVAALQRQHGSEVIRKGVSGRAAHPEALSTGFEGLDALTGCKGIPIGALTLISGRGTTGKITVAYKLLAKTQNSKSTAKASPHLVALVDLYRLANPDYLARCGIKLEHIIVARPDLTVKASHLILDLARSRQVRLLVVDGLSALLAEPSSATAFTTAMRRLPPLLRAAGCAMVLLDDPYPLWQQWLRRNVRRDAWQSVAVHLELHRERWVTYQDDLVGYQTRIEVRRSRWAATGATVMLEILFNGSVQGRTW
jgi:hypothetical protein